MVSAIDRFKCIIIGFKVFKTYMLLKKCPPNISLPRVKALRVKAIQNVLENYYKPRAYILDLPPLGTSQWGNWGSWGVCSVTCGSGTRSRSRTCNGGNNCAGENRVSGTCTRGACPAKPSGPGREIKMICRKQERHYSLSLSLSLQIFYCQG